MCFWEKKMQTETKNKNNLLNMIVLLCCVVYFVSYLTRKNFSVAISGIAESTGLSKSALGSVESALLIVYGFGETDLNRKILCFVELRCQPFVTPSFLFSIR